MPKYVWNGPEDEVFSWHGFDYGPGQPIPMTVEDYIAEVRSGHDLEPYEAEDSGPALTSSPDPDTIRSEQEAQVRLGEVGEGRFNTPPPGSEDDETDESDTLRLGPRQRESLAAYGYVSDSSILAASDEDLQAAGLSPRTVARIRGHG